MSNEQTTLQKEIGKRLKDFRLNSEDQDKENFTAWADNHGIERKQLYKLEHGLNDMKLSSLRKLLNSYDISFEEFFKGL